MSGRVNVRNNFRLHDKRRVLKDRRVRRLALGLTGRVLRHFGSCFDSLLLHVSRIVRADTLCRDAAVLCDFNAVSVGGVDAKS